MTLFAAGAARHDFALEGGDSTAEYSVDNNAWQRDLGFKKNITISIGESQMRTLRLKLRQLIVEPVDLSS